MIVQKWEGIKLRVVVNVSKKRVKNEEVLKEMTDILEICFSYDFKRNGYSLDFRVFLDNSGLFLENFSKQIFQK